MEVTFQTSGTRFGLLTLGEWGGSSWRKQSEWNCLLYNICTVNCLHGRM